MAIASHRLCANCWCTHGMHDPLKFEYIFDYKEPQQLKDGVAKVSLLACVSNGGFIPGTQDVHPYDPG